MRSRLNFISHMGWETSRTELIVLWKGERRNVNGVFHYQVGDVINGMESKRFGDEDWKRWN